jgi:hypothetical protein
MSSIFTHVLFIELIDTKTNELLVDKKLLDIIKDIIISATQIETLPFNNSHDVEILFNWRLVQWSKPYNFLINGDLITTSNYDDDEIINIHTTKLLLGIETFIKAKYLPINDGDWSIVFNILKPLTVHNFKLSLP